ncbi:hypothetical protein TWF694_009001 [Orbilia ellipsospora]|uniref:Uncharacterized protein n=1 Tax=Orbilia ellipsospora TaxID=2528407 RepID=A0AAV9XDN4_9PEZI
MDSQESPEHVSDLETSSSFPIPSTSDTNTPKSSELDLSFLSTTDLFLYGSYSATPNNTPNERYPSTPLLDIPTFHPYLLSNIPDTSAPYIHDIQSHSNPSYPSPISRKTPPDWNLDRYPDNLIDPALLALDAPRIEDQRICIPPWIQPEEASNPNPPSKPRSKRRTNYNKIPLTINPAYLQPGLERGPPPVAPVPNSPSQIPSSTPISIPIPRSRSSYPLPENFIPTYPHTHKIYYPLCSHTAPDKIHTPYLRPRLKLCICPNIPRIVPTIVTFRNGDAGMVNAEVELEVDYSRVCDDCEKLMRRSGRRKRREKGGHVCDTVAAGMSRDMENEEGEEDEREKTKDLIHEGST